MFSALTTLTASPMPDGMRAKRDQENKRIASMSHFWIGFERTMADSQAVAQTDGFPPLMYLLHPNQMLDNDYRLPSYIEPSSTPIIPGVDIATLPEALRELLTNQRDVPEFTEEEAMNGNGAYPSKFTPGDDGWIETPEATGPPADGVYPVLSIDCEMVCPPLSYVMDQELMYRLSRRLVRNLHVYPSSTLRPEKTFSITLSSPLSSHS